MHVDIKCKFALDGYLHDLKRLKTNIPQTFFQTDNTARFVPEAADKQVLKLIVSLARGRSKRIRRDTKIA